MLRAAAHCFNQKGYSGTSLKDVADRLGLTDAALYYYVRNKEELVYLCYVRAADVGRDAMDAAVRDGRSGIDKVRRYLEYHVASMVGEQRAGRDHERNSFADARAPRRDTRALSQAQPGIRSVAG